MAVGCSTARDAPDARAGLERHLNFARNMRIEASMMDAADPAQSVADYARQKQVTQIFVTRHAPDLHKLVRLVRDMQVTIVADRGQ
jgi:K+-sensing histidine kinase KdpD